MADVMGALETRKEADEEARLDVRRHIRFEGLWPETAACVLGDMSKAVRGWDRNAAMTHRTGLVCTNGNEFFVEIPVTRNAAATVSGVNAFRNALPKTPVKSPFPTGCKCYVQPLKCMGTVRRIAQYDNAVVLGKSKELWGIVGPMPI